MRFLLVGDIIGKPGRKALKSAIDELKGKFDALIVNVENAAGGFGINKKVFEELVELGVDVMTSGNHIWDKKEVLEFIDTSSKLLRPANYPEGAPGSGLGIFEKNGISFAVINLMGRTFLDSNLDNPFKLFDKLYDEIKNLVKIIIVDFHAETTSEKWAFGMYVDGRASAVFGTHTHVPTADEIILKSGTGFVSDVGMSGCLYSVIGMRPKEVIDRFIYGFSQRFEVEDSGPIVFNGILLEVCPQSGKAKSISRVRKIFQEVQACATESS
ncbi:MAG: TIGR00282 family metallophosphoesterase [Aquificaceae bacterium]|nr:TIGR00282 family metallophosphoesterase [Aquificaceae bacterium]MDW8237279.1 TIGR00282 family metallophosphoesterase [Aquificaceae bacterium]